jgi:predicted transcriptional regulator
MKKDRNRWEIILDILKITKEEKKVKKTRIMQKANLDWRNFQRYYNFLIEENFIVKCNPENDCYMLTENGGNLLNKLKEVGEVLRERSTTIPVSCQ